jgi:hypothetical protein
MVDSINDVAINNTDLIDIVLSPEILDVCKLITDIAAHMLLKKKNNLFFCVTIPKHI